MFIELDEVIFNSDLIGAVKPINNSQCAIFLAGSSVMDGGFLINLSKEEVKEVLNSTESSHLLKLADELQDEIDSSTKREGKGEKGER